MASASLMRRVIAFCKGREFSSVSPIAEAFPEAGYCAVEATVIDAIRRGLMWGWITETPTLDGPILTVSYIRG